MPEGVGAYPKWQGELSGGPVFPTIAGQEMRRAWQNPWAQGALILAAAYAVIYIGSLWNTSRGSSGAGVHTTDQFLYFLNLLRWAALVVASVMAGSALLEDDRRGALELYLSRAVTRGEYILGKLTAVLGLTFATMYIPALVYFGVSFALFEARPDGWGWVPLKALVYCAFWAFVVTGVGLGLAAATRSPRGGTLILFGGFFAIEIVLTNLLQNITANDQWQVISPFVALAQQGGWLFGAANPQLSLGSNPQPPFSWPYWWGLLSLAVYAAIGWGLLFWKSPKLRGVDA